MTKELKDKKLEIIVFTGGAIIMILELIGARILAPFLGTSIFVWTSLIGIILGAMSLGYFIGGKLSDNNPNFNFLTKLLFYAGLLIFIIPIIKTPILTLSATAGIKLGSVLSTLALFTAPAIVMGMISPYAIRLKAHDVTTVGEVAGKLYALSTLGSIVGTFLAGFYLIPTFGSTQILYVLSMVLIFLSLMGSRKFLKLISLIIIFSVWNVLGVAASNVIYETDSAYNHIRVIDFIPEDSTEEARGLFMATELHSVVFKESRDLHAVYNQLYRLDSIFNQNIESGLALGGGAYIVPLDFLERYQEANMTVVEIDPTVTKVAKEYFGLTDHPRMSIKHEDARIFLNNNTEKFDVLYGDTFASFFSIPFHLTTKEVVKLMYDSLSDDGVAMINIISPLAGPGSKFFQAEYLTFQQQFPQLYIFPSHHYDGDNLEQNQNILLVASKAETRLTKEEMLSRANQSQLRLLEQLWQEKVQISPEIKVLTDEFAPVDFYISQIL